MVSNKKDIVIILEKNKLDLELESTINQILIDNNIDNPSIEDVMTLEKTLLLYGFKLFLIRSTTLNNVNISYKNSEINLIEKYAYSLSNYIEFVYKDTMTNFNFEDCFLEVVLHSNQLFLFLKLRKAL